MQARWPRTESASTWSSATGPRRRTCTRRCAPRNERDKKSPRDKMNKWPTERVLPSATLLYLERKNQISRSAARFCQRYFICVRSLSLSAPRCWVVRAGVILFKSFHVSLPAYVDEDSRPAHALPNLQKVYVRTNLMTTSGFFSQDILFFTYYTAHSAWRSEHNTEKMWSTPKNFIMNLTADEEKLWLKWLVQRALEEIYEVRGFYRGLKLRYEPHAACRPHQERESEHERLT